MAETRLKAVVLAAGKGTRLRIGDTDAPKVMRQARGKPLLSYVLDSLAFIGKADTIIVVGYGRDAVSGFFPGYAYAVQEKQLGTGHAVMAASGMLSGYDGPVLVCYGDMPAVRRETYEALVSEHVESKNACTILTGESSLPLPYGRVLRDVDGAFLHVVEDRDCTPEQKKITELNSGVYVFNSPRLLEALLDLKSDNTQGEYYLTDVPAILGARNLRVGLHKRDLGDEIIGVNTAEQLAQVEEILRKREIM